MRDFVSSHIKERLQSGVHKSLAETPFFYCLKPTTTYVQQPHPIKLPRNVDSVFEHEVELGVVIGENAGRNIPEKYAMNVVAGFCLAIDITARTLQDKAMELGLPWTISKGFDTFCPISEYIPKPHILDPHDLNLWLKVNDQLRQKVNTSQMLIKIPALVEKISALMRLEPGDLILTGTSLSPTIGTPGGVGPINVGDIVTAGMDKDFVRMMFRVVPGSLCREK